MKTYYIGVFNEDGINIGRFHPGWTLENAKVKARYPTQDEPGRGDYVGHYAVFERRAEARKALKACQNYLPGVDYRVIEVGSSARDASRKVIGWVIVRNFRKENEGTDIKLISAHNPYDDRHGWYSGESFKTAYASFDRYGEEYSGHLYARREDARRIIHDLMSDDEGRLPPVKERTYQIEPVYA